MFVAQTNIALYEQMKEYGYGMDDIILMKRAYDFAASARSVSLRGSGKPFICHLVGTASLVVQHRQPIEYCVASLLHAMYLKGSDFGVGMNTRGRRFVVRREFGEDIEKLVHDCHKLKWKYSEQQISDLMSGHYSPASEKIILIKLCNEAEDFLDNAVLYTGAGGTGRKSTAWRLEYMKSAKAKFRQICDYMGYKELGAFIESLIEKSLSAEPVPELQSGYNKSYRNLGPSIRDLRRWPAAITRYFRLRHYFNIVLNAKGSVAFRKRK